MVPTQISSLVSNPNGLYGHVPTNFHSVTYTQTDDAAFEAGSDNDHKSFLRMRVIFKVEYQAELFRFRRVLDDILSSFDVF